MKFTQHDIALLYGEQFFIVPPLHFEKELAKPEIAEAEESVEVVLKAEEAEIKQEETREETAPIVLPFGKEGSAIDWKMKPAAKLALILDPSEFSNRTLTGLLKNCIVQADISTDLVGFGVSVTGATQWDLSNMPVQRAVIFLNHPEGTNYQELEWDGKKIHFSRNLALLQDNESAQSQLIQLLKTLNSTL